MKRKLTFRKREDVKAKKTEANLPEKKTVLIEEFFMSCRHVEKALPNRYDT